MFSISHYGDIAPLHSEPVRQTEYGDGGAVGPAGVKLKESMKYCEGLTVSTLILRGAMY